MLGLYPRHDPAHGVRLSPLRGSVELRTEFLRINRSLRCLPMLDTQIFSSIR